MKQLFDLALEQRLDPLTILERQIIRMRFEQVRLQIEFLHVHLGEYLYETGNDGAALAALESAVELVPAELASPERAWNTPGTNMQAISQTG